jgi:prefoldin subunit 5
LFTIFKKLNIIKKNETDYDKLIKSYSQIFPELYTKIENINKRINEPQEQIDRSDDEIYNEPDSGLQDYHKRIK